MYKQTSLQMDPENKRKFESIYEGSHVSDGAGVNLYRIMGTPQLNQLDPFLLLDEFKSDDSEDYIAGFPSHPHRGFETVTYMKFGAFHHKDSKGNEGHLRSGSVQWMTAGRGIVHSEMPEMEEGLLWGYQLWVNLPAKLKMSEANYQDIAPEDIPLVEEEGLRLKIIAGDRRGITGAAKTLFPVEYFDVQLQTGIEFEQPAPEEKNAFVYVYSGSLSDGTTSADTGQLAVFGAGDMIAIHAGAEGAEFLYLSGKRIGEPVVRGGPFVMNTKEELQQAFADFQSGNF